MATLEGQAKEYKEDPRKYRKDNKIWHYYLNGIKIGTETYLIEFDVISRSDGENHYRVQRLINNTIQKQVL